MTKPFILICLLTCLLTGALGCFGSDPEMNSQCVNGPCQSSTGSGGSAGTSGGGGTAGGGTGGGGGMLGAIVGGPLATFMSGVEGFALNAYHDTGNKNLADPASGADPAPTLTFDAGNGSPDNGSLKVTVKYTGANEYVDIQKNMQATPQDWSGGRTMHVRIKVVSGTFGGGAQVYAITVPSKFYFGGTFTNVAKDNNWHDYTVNLDTPMTPITGYDPKQVIIFGVQLTTGTMGSTGDVVFNIDSFSIDPALPTGSAGAGGGAGGTTGAAGAGGTTGAGGSSDASAG